MSCHYSDFSAEWKTLLAFEVTLPLKTHVVISSPCSWNCDPDMTKPLHLNT